MGVVTPTVQSSRTVAEPWRSALVLALFAALLALVGPRHEPWFDEAQAWLIARDTTLWDLLAHRVRYEGTPGLWHVLLWLLSRAGVPFAYLWVASGALACVGAWIILTRAPFPYWLRVGIVLSYFVAYQYAVVARSYALDLVLIPLIAVVFADRLRRPVLYGALLGLCANANAQSFIIAGALFAEFLVAVWRGGNARPGHWQRAQLAGGAIYVALAGAAVLQAWPPPDVSFLSLHGPATGRGVMMVVEAFVDRLDIWSASPPTVLQTYFGVLVTALLLAPSFMLFRRAGIAMLMTVVFVALTGFSIMTFANAWHAGLLFLLWVFALWISWSKLDTQGAVHGRLTIASAAAVVAVGVFYTASAALREVREPYSAAPAVAQMLAPGDARIAAVGFKTFAVQPWFAANAFANYRGGAPYVAYHAWRRGEGFPSFVTPERWYEAANDRRYDTLLLSDHRMLPDELARHVATARAAGYCGPSTLPGGLIWKSYVREADAMLVFRRCAGGLAGIAGGK